tara:strand:- start:3763 stop:4530 length:768 start_codon:yes stop_codon:yes gene_type:complete
MLETKVVTERFKNKRLDSILVEMNLVSSRQKAVSLIMRGNVFVEEEKISKPGKIIKINQKIQLKKSDLNWVSRGGIKLDAAIRKFKINVEGKVSLDIGCSTGGFSDVLLKNRVKRIFAVDVGYGQFEWKLRSSKRITLYEKTNARYIKPEMIPDFIDLIVCDVSFISAKKVIEPNIKFLKKEFEIIVLIKPQFEVQKNLVGRGGIIKDEKIHKDVCNDFKGWINKKFDPDFLKIMDSPITGQKGNKEFLLYFGVL